MESSRIRMEKQLSVFVNRTVLFFFFTSLLTLFLYAAGTVQAFIDSTQLFLLRLYETLGIFLLVTSVCGVLFDFDRFFKTKKKRYLFRAAGYLLLIVFAAVTVLMVMAILALSGGNRAL